MKKQKNVLGYEAVIYSMNWLDNIYPLMGYKKKSNHNFDGSSTNGRWCV